MLCVVPTINDKTVEHLMYLLHASAMVKNCFDCIFNGMGYEYNGIHHKGVFNSVYYVSIKFVLFLSCLFFDLSTNIVNFQTYIYINYCFDYLPSVLTYYFNAINISIIPYIHSILLHYKICYFAMLWRAMLYSFLCTSRTRAILQVSVQ